MKVHTTTHLTLPQIAGELGISRARAVKVMAKVAWAYPVTTHRGRTLYDARVVDLIRALHGQPHRTLEPAHSDWLASYLKENAHGTAPQGSDVRTP